VLPGPAVPNSGGWVPRWLLGLGPVMLLGLLVWAILALEPLSILRGESFPPIEKLTLTETPLPDPGRIQLHGVNGGPDPVTIALMMVDEACWYRPGALPIPPERLPLKASPSRGEVWRGLCAESCRLTRPLPVLSPERGGNRETRRMD